MASYLQMGHDTQNLVGEEGLEKFSGIILSPLNREPANLKHDISSFRKIDEYDIVFDPQLYYPHTDKVKLQNHPYFPDDFESADYTNNNWWMSIHNKIYEYCVNLQVDLIIAPTIDPKSLDDNYYSFNIHNINQFCSLQPPDIKSIWAPIIINLNDLAQKEKPQRLASLTSQIEAEKIYLIIKTDIEPRRELADSLLITKLLQFIRELTQIEKDIVIAFSSFDMMIFKAAGADHCATSKFFNLRRFTPSRFDDNSGGGGQLPYFFSESLSAFLRETDMIRLLEKGKEELLTSCLKENLWNDRILKKINSDSKTPWLGDSWRQYLSWFSNAEEMISSGDTENTVMNILKEAEKNWLLLEDENILFDETRNDGSWIRKWRIALSDLK